MPPRSRAPRLSRFELRVMQVFWDHGALTVREVLDRSPGRHRPAYTTVQTIVRRLEEKGAVRCARKVGNAHVYEPVVAREAACSTLIGDLLALFGGASFPLIAHLVETGRVDEDDLKAAEELLEKRS